MEVKGTAVESLPKFVSDKHGAGGLERWISALSPEAKEVFRGRILSSSWYDLLKILVEPTQKVNELFYGNTMKGALEVGRYSAEMGLRGIYKLFVKLGSPEFIIKKAGVILPTYYRPCAMEVVKLESGSCTVRITQFPQPHAVVESRIQGWMEKALAIAGAKNVLVKIPVSLTSGKEHTDFDVTWAA